MNTLPLGMIFALSVTTYLAGAFASLACWRKAALARYICCSAALVGCGAQKHGPTENLFHVTLLHQFKELRSARWKSIDSKYVRAAWSFDEAQIDLRWLDSQSFLI